MGKKDIIDVIDGVVAKGQFASQNVRIHFGKTPQDTKVFVGVLGKQPVEIQNLVKKIIITCDAEQPFTTFELELVKK